MSKEYQVTAHYADLGQKKNKKGEPVTVRLTKVKWGKGEPRWDLRAWSAKDEPEQGFTLTDEMVRNLKNTLISVEL